MKATGNVPGSLFCLKPSFFEGLTAGGASAASLKDDGSGARSHAQDAGISADGRRGPYWNEQGATCIACNIGVTSPGFATPSEQRAHFKTDWHRFNVKRRLNKQPALSEDNFERLLEEAAEVDSISGSESSEGGQQLDDVVDGEEEEPRGEGGRVAAPGGSGRGSGASGPRAVFSGADGKLYGVWRCLLMAEDSRSKRATMSPAELLQALRRMRASARLWVVIMLTGGHLAAAVFRMHSSGDSGGDAGADASDTAAAATTSASASTAASAAGGKSSRAPAAPSGSGSGDGDGFSVLDHKTFHRYVVRAKAGGKQSSKDATGKVAHSAGSALRRYNESALERDIHELLASWKHHIDAADLVFVHAPSSNGKTLFAEGQKTLAASDPRVRRIPFVSRRPTYAEVQRCVRLLCQVVEVPPLPAAAAPVPEASGGTAADAAAEQLRGLKVSGPAGTKAIEPTADSDGEEEEEKEEEPGVQPSALHLAARAGDATTVASLLEAGADPCARDARGKTPYMLAVDKATRDEFRRFMGRRPGQWDYAAAAIPSALTDDMEAAQQAKKAEKKAKMKAREAERKRAAAEGVEERKARAAAALDAEIAAAAAAAAAVSAKMDAASKAGPLPSSFSSSAAGRAKPKVGGGGGGGAKAGSGSSGSARRAPSSSSSSSSAQPPSAEELARRREMMAAAAEARMKALQAAAAQQKLW